MPLTLVDQLRWKSTKFQRGKAKERGPKKSHFRKEMAGIKGNRKTAKAKANHSMVAKVMQPIPPKEERDSQRMLMQTDATTAMVMDTGRKTAGSINRTKLLDLFDRLKATKQLNVLHLAPVGPAMPNSLQAPLRTDHQVMSIELHSMIAQ